ncbi:hypothetical protein GGF49_001952 [Coemansia sp. RSA 1853]|nr:hypothetical protein GGF49_001952 [Coemansia sp. RSA 1853]
MTVNNISVTEASGVLSETMGPKITSTESSARVEDAAIKNVEASAEDKQSYAEENVILKMVLKKYDDILNSARKEMATMNVEELAEDEKSSELCDSVTKDEQSYIEEIDILKTV